MSKPIPLLPERIATERAVKELQAGQPSAALELLRHALRRRKRSTSGPDDRPDDIVRLRAYMEQATVELEHGDPDSALRTLRNAVRTPGPNA
jgi:hypothetical protein